MHYINFSTVYVQVFLHQCGVFASTNFLWKLSKQLNFCQLLSKILGLIGKDGNTDDLQYNNTSIHYVACDIGLKKTA